MDLLSNNTAQDVILRFKSQFARHGIPEVVHSDNGPQFTSQMFADFADAYKFRHTSSSPYNQHANGLAEKGVQTIKNLLEKASEDNRDPYLALLAYRNTPRSAEIASPAQRLFSRRLRTPLPMKASLLTPKVNNSRKELDQARSQQTQSYDCNARKLKPFDVSQKVWYKTEGLVGKWLKGVIVKCLAPSSYLVETQNGK